MTIAKSKSLDGKDPITRAYEYLALKQQGQTDMQIAKHFGLHQSDVSYTLRLLELPGYVQDALQAERLSWTSGRLLCRLLPRPTLFDNIAPQVISGAVNSKALLRLIREQIPHDPITGRAVHVPRTANLLPTHRPKREES